MAGALAREDSLFWPVLSRFSGCGTTLAKPALIAVAAGAAETAAEGGFVAANDTAKSEYALDCG